MTEKKPYYITTPIYYPSDNLHLGHTYTTIIADTLKNIKRYKAMMYFLQQEQTNMGKSFFKNQKKAGKTPLEYIDPIVASTRVMEKMRINYDAYTKKHRSTA